MFFNININPQRPNQLNQVKDKDYHVKFGRWTLNGLNDVYYQQFIMKTLLNWSFYKGGDGQWVLDEDLEDFFLDESGDVRNRLKWTKNLIRPMVQQYIGNAVRMSYTARAETTGDFVVNRREQEWNNLAGYFGMAQKVPELKNIISDRVPIRETLDETKEDFDLMFDDDLAETINNLLTWYERDIDMEEMKKMICTMLAISGLGIYKGFYSNNKYNGDFIDPLFHFFDRSARKPDLSDAGYMGEWYWMETSTIFEKWQHLSDTEKQAVEKAAVNYSNQNRINSMFSYSGSYSGYNGKVTVFETYWKDNVEQEYAYVNDRFGYPFFTRINSDDSEFKTKDAIEPPVDDRKKKELGFKGKAKTTKIVVETLRYCIFIPGEQIGNKEDIVLEWGEVPYQETYKYDPSSTKFPYKCYTWNYDKGEIISPLDDAIKPQRMINRLISVAEAQINNAGVTGNAVDINAIPAHLGPGAEEQVVRDINRGKTVVLDTTRTGSIQNSIGQYGTTLHPNVFNVWNVIKEFQVSMADVTGVNESMTGTMGGPDVAVGVTEAMIGRGSLIQEPFYYALTKILKQAYQHMATVGKKIIYDNPRRAAMIMGDKGYQILTVTKDHLLEDFRVWIERSESPATAVQNGNALVFTLMQAGLLDPFRASMLLGRATPDQVTKSMREYQMEQAYAKKEQDKYNQQRMMIAGQEQQQMMNEQRGMMQQQRADQMAENQADREVELEKEAMKQQGALENSIVATELNSRNNLQKSK